MFRRAGFGATAAELSGALAIGVDRTIDTLLVAPGWPIPSQGVFMLPNTGEIVNMNQTNGQIGAWLYLMQNSPFPLTEKLCLFWHDHFATGINKVQYANMMGDQINIFRRFGLRSFRSLLIEVSKDPAMLYWLDNRLSTKAKPNENYAREVFELYSMGVTGPYTENDVQEAARALTGFTAIYGYSYFNANNHDTGVKTILGKQLNNGAGTAGAKDLEDLVDIILGTPATSKYMVRKIWEYFVYENPSQAFIDQLAARWVQDKYDVRALMETIFRSKAFFSSRSMGGLVKNPVEYMVGALRNLGEVNVNYSRVAARMTPLYALLNYDNPSGLPDGIAWIDSQALLNRANYGRDVVQQRNSYIRFLFSGMPYLPPFDVAKVIADNKLDTPTKIVDWFLDALVAVPVPAAVRTNLITFMTSDNGTTSFQWNEASHAQRKGAGLIHLILALPEAQMN
ncbi:MAG: DUF1800 domain-containing protein [Planctomycetota bacterium]